MAATSRIPPAPANAAGSCGDTPKNIADATCEQRGRVDLRFAVDSGGEIYILTKTDGVIRRVVGIK